MFVVERGSKINKTINEINANKGKSRLVAFFMFNYIFYVQTFKT